MRGFPSPGGAIVPNGNGNGFGFGGGARGLAPDPKTLRAIAARTGGKPAAIFELVLVLVRRQRDTGPGRGSARTRASCGHLGSASKRSMRIA